MTRITSAIAAALVASVSFATAALAAGDYYEGATPPSAGVQLPATHEHSHPGVSYGYTGSIARATGAGIQNGRDSSNGEVVLGRGDYYEGANRPN